MGEETLVSGDGWISDDSSFYGDEAEQEQLITFSGGLDSRQYWSAHENDLNVCLARQRSMPPPKLFNPGEGRSDSWQLAESPEEFIKRLPPLTTSGMSCEWIWIYNPYAKIHSMSKPANETDFMSRGPELLVRSLQTRNDIQTKGPWTATGTIMRMLNEEGKLLQQRITDLAVKTNVISGKWMLFPELEDLTRVWRLVIDGIINNRLGTAAKVAPDEGKSGARLICVYTKDFRDKEDILRVLKELVSMGVVGAGRPIYYKSDSYTLLDIYSRNAAEYGLQASLYSSQRMLSEAAHGNSTLASQKKQSTLQGFIGSHDSADLD